MAAKQKVVLLLGLHENDAKEKRKVLKAVSTFPGLDLIAVDMKQSKLTVVGLVDPIELVTKLRKLWHADILFVGPAKEGDKGNQEAATARQVVESRPAADVRSSWSQEAVYVYPPRPGHPYPDGHPHQHITYGGYGAQHDPYVAHVHGAQENHPNSYYVAHGHGAARDPNGCAIC